MKYKSPIVNGNTNHNTTEQQNLKCSQQSNLKCRLPIQTTIQISKYSKLIICFHQGCYFT